MPLGGALIAQQPDTLRPPVPATGQPARPDSVTSVLPPLERVAPSGAPISPGRAFLQSLLIPGRGQITLGKRNASRFYMAVEALGIGMTIKSVSALREAKRVARDSTPLEFTVDPATGDSTATVWVASRFPPERINARRTHVEDWVALIIFNHLLSAADAYVAANLWDFPGKVSLRARPTNGLPQHGNAPPLPLKLEARVTGSITW
jgi:uncharacterized protein DUF5683